MVLTQKAIQASTVGDVIDVLVDNAAARENVTRFATSQGCKVDTELPAGRGAGDDDAYDECYIVRITVGGRA